MNFQDLTTLMDIEYRREQQILGHLVEKENLLRAELKKLNDHELQNRSVSFEEKSAATTIGADILWSKWLEKAQVKLNYELARVLVEKEQNISRVRKAYGKVLVGRATVDRISRARSYDLAQESLSRSIEFSIFD
jgi:hypothetical protein